MRRHITHEAVFDIRAKELWATCFGERCEYMQNSGA